MQPIDFNIISVLMDLRTGLMETVTLMPGPAVYALIAGFIIIVPGLFRRRFRRYISIH
ncbi:MAG: hypothetical protein ACFBZ8_05680 [Opitutales bacterium]